MARKSSACTLYICISIYIYFYISIYLYFYISMYLYIYISIYLYIYLYFYISIYLYTYHFCENCIPRQHLIHINNYLYIHEVPIDSMNILSFNVFLGKQLWHAYTKTTYQNQWSHRKQTTKNRVKDEHTANGTSPKSFDLSYDQTCRKNIKYAKTKNNVFLGTWRRYTLKKKGCPTYRLNPYPRFLACKGISL